ncbi:MAG: hypothetical protein MZU95_09780 [Desulfomicrobium escambiense]|nr:hypothetical protein [Desulfomicrobium escambiense]
MLSTAAGYAETHRISHVLIASHAGDHPIYPELHPRVRRGDITGRHARDLHRSDDQRPLFGIRQAQDRTDRSGSWLRFHQDPVALQRPGGALRDMRNLSGTQVRTGLRCGP